jgi:hypothetical protein
MTTKYSVEKPEKMPEMLQEALLSVNDEDLEVVFLEKTELLSSNTTEKLRGIF